jgi:hypothetical protein
VAGPVPIVERVVLLGVSVPFAAVAVLGWFAPDVLFRPIGVSIGDAAGYAEVRAAYGGLFGAGALVFAAGALRPDVTAFALRFGVLVLRGFVFGRLYSLGVDGVPNAVAFAALAAEVIGLFVCAAALRARGRRLADTVRVE